MKGGREGEREGEGGSGSGSGSEREAEGQRGREREGERERELPPGHPAGVSLAATAFFFITLKPRVE